MKETEPVLRIGTTVSGKWIWQLRTADRHVVNVSAGFDTREACEADAKKNGLKLPKKRVRKPRVALEIVPVRHQPGAWRIYEDASGLWHWKAPSGAAQAESSCAFLTRRECVADAHKHGFAPEQALEAK